MTPEEAAEIQREEAEATIAKLKVERLKLIAERRKLEREFQYMPIVTAVAAVTIVFGIIKFFLS